MKKKVFFVIIVVIILAILLALIYLYNNKLWIFDPYRDANLNPEEVFENISSNLDLPSMENLDMESVKSIYGDIDDSKIISFSVNIPFMNIRADEFAIFKVNDKEYIKDLKLILESRAKSVESSFEGYINEQYLVAKDYKIMTYNDVIILIITKDFNKVLKIIDDMII